MAPKTAAMQRAEELVRMHVDFFNHRNLEEGKRHVSSDFEWTVVPLEKTFHGPKGYVEANKRWMDAFPDGKCDVTRVTAHGDTAVLEFRGHGTHKGTLEGPQGSILATGKKVDMPFIEVYEFRDDKLQGGRTYFDAATMMRQLGVKA